MCHLFTWVTPGCYNYREDVPNSPGGYGPRVPPSQNITEDPTKVDPRVLAEGTKGYFSAQRVSLRQNHQRIVS